MRAWQQQLQFDPLPALQSSLNKAIAYFTRRDLLDTKVEPIEILWRSPAAERILERQLCNGAWRYPGDGKATGRRRTTAISRPIARSASRWGISA